MSKQSNMLRKGVLARIALSLLLVLGQVGSFAHALSHLEHGHAHAGHGDSQDGAADSDHASSADHASGCDEQHAHADSHSDRGIDPVCELCAAFGAAAALLASSNSTSVVHPRRSARFVATVCPSSRFLFCGAYIRAPPAIRV